MMGQEPVAGVRKRTRRVVFIEFSPDCLCSVRLPCWQRRSGGGGFGDSDQPPYLTVSYLLSGFGITAGYHRLFHAAASGATR